MFRIGQGYDVHRLVKGRPLILGGVPIAHALGLDGHSDADVLLHAICDALLGAAALGDIGQHFPPDDPSLKDVDSQVLLAKVGQLLADKGFDIQNVDSTIIAEKPKLMPHIKAMCRNIADCLQLDIAQVSVKATTTERLGFTGEEQGIAAQAICLVCEQTSHAGAEPTS